MHKFFLVIQIPVLLGFSAQLNAQIVEDYKHSHSYEFKQMPPAKVSETGGATSAGSTNKSDNKNPNLVSATDKTKVTPMQSEKPVAGVEKTTDSKSSTPNR